MPVNLQLKPLESLFEEGPPITKDLLKDSVVADFKQKELTGIPETQLRINFSPESGDDILIHRIDPENALGYSVHASEEDYFNHLSASLYEPTEEDILGGLDGS